MGKGGGGRGEKRKEVSLLQLSPFFASIFSFFPRNDPETPDTLANNDET